MLLQMQFAGPNVDFFLNAQNTFWYNKYFFELAN